MEKLSYTPPTPVFSGKFGGEPFHQPNETIVTKVHQKSFSDLLDFAHKLADRSGEVILQQFRRRLDIENKAGKQGFDPVTIADRAAERAIRKLITANYPDHGIHGEEFGLQDANSPFQWIIDPIDGTRAFVIGLPIWGTLIALTAEGKPVLGVMNQPYTGERFWSGPAASYFSGTDGRRRKLRTRACQDLSAAMLTTTHPDFFNRGKQQRAFNKLKAEVRDTRYGGDCYTYCLLAAGHIDIIIESNLKSYDIAALIPIVERAGGTITTWTGGPATNGGNIIATGDSRLHDQALALIN